ncbi:conserved hypothetical protein [Candidatus Zixiibacteriota bacterium]|nr:conserved hypothetical protein [candidate division Zixibacteria bacterium]
MNKLIENRNLDDMVRDTAIRAMGERIAGTPEEIFKRLQASQFTKGQIDKAWNYGIAEGEDVTMTWGIVQGLTAYARELPFIDKRVNLERRAGALLAT